MHSTGFGDFRYIYDVHDVTKWENYGPRSSLLTPTPPNAAAAEKKIDRRATAAGQNHPAHHRRKNDIGAGLYVDIHE